MTCAPSEDSDQPGHPPSLIRVFAVRFMDSWGPNASSCGQRRLWSGWSELLLGAHIILLVLSWGGLNVYAQKFSHSYSEQCRWTNRFNPNCLLSWIEFFLAHLSRRLTRWAYSIPMVRRRRPHFQTWTSLKPFGQSWSDIICCITGGRGGGGCIRF